MYYITAISGLKFSCLHQVCMSYTNSSTRSKMELLKENENNIKKVNRELMLDSSKVLNPSNYKIPEGKSLKENNI